ncbi:MAG: homocysteine S-methyltransferase family protein [Bacteroidetes bacterium]|nr:homocysteine S-methyltransferase family protein [Bacteroidota bacterium]
MPFEERLKSSRILLLDGATGSELERRGISTELPLWSTIALLSKEGRSVLRRLHQDYIEAGAVLITANTFRTNPYTLKKESLEDKAAYLTRAAVDDARSAMDAAAMPYEVFIAGSVAPVEDCYRPDLVPKEEVLWDDHRRHIDHLYEAGVDLILIETMNTIREAMLAAQYAIETEKPVMVSFILKDPEHLLGGEEVLRASGEIAALGPSAILLNCIGLDLLKDAMGVLRAGVSGPVGGYANVVDTGDALDPEGYAVRMKELAEAAEMKIVGGCCGTTPEHISCLKEKLRSHPTDSGSNLG